MKKEKTPIGLIIFGSLVFVLFVYLASSMIVQCTSENGWNPDKHYLHEYVTVVDKYPPTMEKYGKYMVEVKKLLVRRVKDTTMYAELGCGDWWTFKHDDKEYLKRGETYFDSLYYNTPIGGKLYFSYISKSRFFHIYKR